MGPWISLFMIGRREIPHGVSVDQQGRDPNGASYEPALSADGRYVAFGSWASNLVAGDGNRDWLDIFVYDRETETTTRVSDRFRGGRSLMATVTNRLSVLMGDFVAFSVRSHQPGVRG